MSKSTINAVLMTAAGVALAIFVVNRFTQGGLSSFGVPQTNQNRR